MSAVGGSVDILFLAHGRKEFTTESLRCLVGNTPEVERVGKGSTLSIYTDADPDPSQAFNLAMRTCAPIWRVNNERHGGPVACLNDFLQSTAPGAANDPDGNPQRPPEATPEFIAKIDNDTIVPPGWLPACLDLMRRYPNVDLLGIEPWTPDEKLFPRWVEPLQICYGGQHGGHPTSECSDHQQTIIPRPVSHIGGIGVFRRSAFERFGRPIPNSQDGRYGFTEWQWDNPGMVKAFIDPPLPVFLLDHLPLYPWNAISDKYEREGIQRNVGWKYDRVKHRALWDWWLASREDERAEKFNVGGPR